MDKRSNYSDEQNNKRAKAIEKKARSNEMVGKTYNSLVVMQVAHGKDENGLQLMALLCKCECGNIVEAWAKDVITGKVKSCGCLEGNNRNKAKKFNGQRFGKLTVVENTRDYIKLNGKRVRMLRCQCDCGNIREVSLEKLRKQIVVDCGYCGSQEQDAKYSGDMRYDLTKQERRKKNGGEYRPKEDITGYRFGRLIVEEMMRIESSPGKYEYKCKCLCDCGNEVIVNTSSIKDGSTKSCGCLRVGPDYYGI